MPKEIEVVNSKHAGASVYAVPDWVEHANYGTNRLGDDNAPNQANNVPLQLQLARYVPNTNNNNNLE